MGAIFIEPAVVKWVVETSGMEREDLAKILRVDDATVGTWIRTGKMNYGMMRKLAKLTSISESLFLLKTPPPEERLPDYRMTEGAMGPEVAAAIRRARYAQAAARGMMGRLGIDPEPRIGGVATTDDSPEDAARREAQALGVSGALERAARDSSEDLYGRLRTSIEARNILAFQEDMDGGTVRGVSLTGTAPCAVVVNAGDAAGSKTFTLLHEYGHVVLGKGGMCSEMESDERGSGVAGEIETWCDRFAASALMQGSSFAEELAHLEEREGGGRAVVDGLARRFGISGYAAAVMSAGARAGARGREYAAARADLANKCAADAAAGRRRGGRGRRADPTLQAVSRLGHRFVGLVLASYDGGSISTRDAINYLGMDIGHFDRLRQAMAPHG